MEQERPTFNTTVWVVGDGLDPDEFTQVVSIEPTKTTRKGKLSPHPAAKIKGWKSPATSWTLNYKHPSYSMDESVKKLLGIVWAKRDYILAYVRDHSDVTVGITSTPYVYGGTVEAEYDLSSETIQKLAYLECKFGMDDVYDYRPSLPLPPHLRGLEGEGPILTTNFQIGGDAFDVEAWKEAVKEDPPGAWNNSQDNSGHFSQDFEKCSDDRLWNLTRTSRHYSTDEAIQEVLDLLWVQHEAVQVYISTRVGILSRIQCRIELVKDRPVYELQANTLQRLGLLGCAMNLEVFNYEQDDIE